MLIILKIAVVIFDGVVNMIVNIQQIDAVKNSNDSNRSVIYINRSKLLKYWPLTCNVDVWKKYQIILTIHIYDQISNSLVNLSIYYRQLLTFSSNQNAMQRWNPFKMAAHGPSVFHSLLQRISSSSNSFSINFTSSWLIWSAQFVVC